MPASKPTSTTHLNRVLSPSDQLTIAAHLQALRRQEDNLRTLAAAWPIPQRRQLLRYVNQNRRTRLNIWATLDISTAVLP